MAICVVFIEYRANNRLGLVQENETTLRQMPTHAPASPVGSLIVVWFDQNESLRRDPAKRPANIRNIRYYLFK